MIDVVGLRKRFLMSEALCGVSLHVAQGDIFGFVGPNGAGKTTTIKILATLSVPDSGSAVVAGVDVVRNPEAARAGIGYMPDFFGVYDALTAAEYLAFYASCYRIPRARAHHIVGDLLELVGLAAKRDAPVDTLSRGMKQRLCLARALVHDPQVLLLDEPASGLDPRARVEMRELLRELRRMGKTIVISSHILPELAEMCSTVGIIDAGRMVATGPIDLLLHGGGRRRATLRVTGDRDAQLGLAESAGITAAPGEGDAEIVVEFDGGDDEAAEVLARLVRAGVRVVAYTPHGESLEEVFLRVTGGAGAEPSAAEAVA